MRFRLRDRPLRQQITMIIVATSVAALGLATTASMVSAVAEAVVALVGMADAMEEGFLSAEFGVAVDGLLTQDEAAITCPTSLRDR